MKKNRKYLLFVLFLLFTSCIHIDEEQTLASLKPKERLKLINEAHLEYSEKLNKFAPNQYTYIKKFTDSLIKSGLNYVQYMSENKIIDCSEIVDIFRIKKGKLFENRQWFDEYFESIDTSRMIHFRILTGNPLVFDQIGKEIIEYRENQIQYSLYDLKYNVELEFNFAYDTLLAQNGFESNLKLVYLTVGNNPYGVDYYRYLTDDIQEHCDYLKEFMLELINHKYDYIEYLKNNPYVKIRESESSSLETFFSKDNKNLNYYDKKLKNYVDCVFKDEYILFSTLDEDDLEECLKLSKQGLFYSVHGCNDQITFYFYFEPNQQDPSKYDYYLINIDSSRQFYEQHSSPDSD